MGIPAGELRQVGASDPAQQPTGVVNAGVGAHQVEHGPGVVDQVTGQAGGAGEGVGADWSGPAVTQVASQVQEREPQLPSVVTHHQPVQSGKLRTRQFRRPSQDGAGLERLQAPLAVLGQPGIDRRSGHPQRRRDLVGMPIRASQQGGSA
jgi:hypothetical protein